MFFFTELDKLDPQGANQAFGPVATDPDSKFLLTNKFTIKPGVTATAFMPLRGSILVLPQANNQQSPLVNVAIRVHEQPSGIYAPIHFIIYRGIRKDSIFTSAGKIKPAATSSLTTLLWRNWYEAIAKPNSDAAPDGPQPKDIGWTATGAAPDLPLEAIFEPNPLELQLPVLDAGHSLGVFSSTADIGIDIILGDPIATPSLSLVYPAETVLTIPSGPRSVTNQLPSVRRQRQRVMAYLDVSLFYALGAGSPGVGCQGPSGFELLKTPDDIYKKLLFFCAGRNTVYLDLRNEVSLPLNHYSEYQDAQATTGSPVWLSTSSNPTVQLAPFLGSSAWPLYPLSLAGTPAPTVRLAFPTMHNPDPLVYREYGTLHLSEAQQKEFSKQTEFISLYDNGYSTTQLSSVISREIAFKLPQVTNAQGVVVNTCGAIRLMVLRRTVARSFVDTQAASARDTYLENLFGPVQPLTAVSTRRLFAKRWLCQGDLQSKTIVGAIVEPVRASNDKQVIFTLSVLASYASGALGQPGLSEERELSQFGADMLCRDVSWEGENVTLYDLHYKYNLPAFGQDWERSMLGTQMSAVKLSTATATEVQVFSDWAMPHEPDKTLSLALGRQEYDSLALQVSYFDPGSDVYCSFRPFTVEPTLDINPQTWQSTVISSQVVLAGFAGEHYLVMTENQVGLNVRAFSLDSLHFNTAASGAATTLPLVAPPVEEYSVADYLRDLRAVEAVYEQRDTRLDQSVTRQRVHYYGFIHEDVPPFNIMAPLDTLRSLGGYVFNLDIPRADYWEAISGPPYTAANPYLQVPPDALDVPNRRVRQMYASDPGMSSALVGRLGRKNVPYGVQYPRVRGQVRNGTHLIDPGGNLVDLGHTLYTFDALFTYPDVPRPRQNTPRPSNAFETLGVESSVDLTTFIGDLTGTLASAYNEYFNELTSLQVNYTIRQHIDFKYLDTSPLGDLNSDTDGFGLRHVWENVFQKRLDVRLSDLMEYFYSDDSPVEHSYRSRWKIFCLRNNFVVFQNGQYRWLPNMPDLRHRMEVGYLVGYSAEANKKSMGTFMGSQGVFFERYLRRHLHALQAGDSDYVLNKFLDQVKALLRLEQPTWQVVY